MQASALSGTQVPSPLAAQATLRPKRGVSAKRILISSLMLTSLVDAFSILVIFLLMNAQHGIAEIELKKTSQLPTASRVEALQKGLVLRIEEGRYWLDDQLVAESDLTARLESAKTGFESRQGNGQKANLIVQADKNLDFAALSPILRAASVAGLSHFKFAVIEKAAGI